MDKNEPLLYHVFSIGLACLFGILFIILMRSTDPNIQAGDFYQETTLDCKEWAFGQDVHSWKEVVEVWNKKHSNNFVLKETDDPKKFFELINDYCNNFGINKPYATVDTIRYRIGK